MSHKHIGDVLVPESAVIRIFNQLFEVDFSVHDQLLAYTKRTEFNDYRAHIDQCRKCGPRGRCASGARLLREAKSKIDEQDSPA